MISNKTRRDNATIIDMLIAILTAITVLLFLSSYSNNINFLKISIQVFGIAYLIGFILFLLLRRKYKITKMVSAPKIKIIEKPIYIKEQKRKVTKKYTGSTYGKIYHRRECRFSESIMDKYFEEHDEKSYFEKKNYKPCGLCKPNKIIKTDDSNIKQDKK